jgi:alanine racemase
VHNLQRIRDRVRPREIWPVVKANAYGHGAVRVAQALAREQVAGFCVATATEGRELRQNGIAAPILVMAGLSPGGAEDPFEMIVEYGLTAAVPDATTADRLAEAARAMRIGPAAVHLKIDTGMGRIGVSTDQVVGLAAAIRADPALSFDGLFSNLATADSTAADAPGTTLVAAQVEQFRRACRELEAQSNLPKVRTLGNSAAVCHHPSAWEGIEFTGVRPGLAIYGATLTPESPRLALRPAMRWRTEIAAVRRLPEGASVGYGADTVLRRPSRVAVLPLGYHDGLPRVIGARAEVLVRGRRVPLLGRISMDITLLDVTDVSAAAAGDAVVLFGPEAAVADQIEGRETVYADALATAVGAAGSGREPATPRQSPRRGAPTVEEFAAWAETIPHEILCRIAPRVPRRYLDDVGGSTR